MRYFYYISVLVLLLSISAKQTFGQAPINDNCVSALPINIPLNDFAMGIYYSDTINLTNSTLQTGEYFHYVQVSAGTDKKSIWYKFHLPTARSVKIDLLQPNNLLPEDAAGFTVYYGANCLPVSSAISAAKLTPVNKFGSSYNPCLLPGDYLIQVSAKSSANNQVFIKLTVDETFVLKDYDRLINAQNIGTLSDGWHYSSFDVGCQTIENELEVCHSLGFNYKEYTQSTWHVFKTDNFVDVVRWQLHEANGKYTGNLKVGYVLYEGDVRSTPISSLTVVDGCKVLHPTGHWYGNPYWAGKSWLCLLKPKTSYSLQVFYHKDYTNTIEFAWYERGIGNTHSPDPANISSSTKLGTLPMSATGTWTYGYDTLSCNAFIKDHPCGNANPASGTVTSTGYTYQLSTWYTFKITDYANVRFYTNGELGKRLYAGDISANCNLSPIWEFRNYDITYPCLPAGTYSVQILGKIDTTANNINTTYYNNIGIAANLSLQVFNVDIVNNYQLTASGLIDSVNHNTPLPNGTSVYSNTAYFGCPNTVLPDGSSCDVNNKKAIYRRIVIDTLGMLTMGGGNYNFLYILYKGDASALATAQNKFSYGQKITGLDPMTSCINLYWTTSPICVKPGVYTLVSFGDSTDVSQYDRPWFKFDKLYTKYYNPSVPNDMGDITAGIKAGTVSGTVDYFSCIDNPLTIDEQVSCSNYNKLIYRQLYIGEPLIVNISISSGYFRIFKGKITDGVGTLSANIPGYGNLGCRYNFYSDVCIPMQPGWYTVVSYGNGGVYDGPTYSGGMIGHSNNINVWTTAPLHKSEHNRPHIAYNAGTTDFGPNAGTITYPNKSRTYSFGTDYFTCIPDTPFSAHPVDPCPSNYNRASYFVFKITKESFVSLYGIPSSMISRVYPFDVRTDSLLMMSVPPVQPCISRTDISHYERWYWTWTGKIEFCRLQPGSYTLVVFANNSHINTSFTPSMYVDTVAYSRFDHALSAYDFDLVPGDSVTYYGRIGDTNPLDPARKPSDDFISCTTGAQVSDPGLSDPQNLCWNGLFPYSSKSTSILYPITANESVYDTIGTTNVPVRRNVWYTFVVQGPGKVYVSVKNRTTGKTSPILPFTIYKSDVDGALPFASLAGTDQLDSTIASGLTYVLNNSTFDWYGCAGNLETIVFPINPCEQMAKRRYYVLVDEHAGMMVTNQFDVSVKFESVPVTTLRYDHYSEANVINGLNQASPPYTAVALNSGTYSGYSASFACATKDASDQNTCGTKTLWYKFTSNTSGKIRVNYTIDGITTTVDARDFMLFKESIQGDSTSIGLKLVPHTIITIAGKQWAEHCLNQGTYYIMLTGCNYTIEMVKPNIWLIDQEGDLCSNPVPLSLSAPGSISNSVNIDCHSIGEAYGEDGSSMGCLFGPAGYKSTWFKVNLNMSINVDLSFKLAENTTSLPSQIRYRVLYGTCNSMTAGPCNSDALTEFTLNCMATDSNDYYVQIVSPLNATGTLTLTVKADSAPNQSCVPFNPIAPIANFIVNNGCAGDSICFVNKSTLGDSIRYNWDFGEIAITTDTSSRKNPCWLYPVPLSNDTVMYYVRLIVTNITNGLKDTVIIGVPVYPKPNAVITRDVPQNGYYVSAGGNVNFHSNSTNITDAPPAIWHWDLSNGTFSNDTNPSGVIYGPTDLGINIVILELSNGDCKITVRDTFFVKYEDVYKGGFYDGADLDIIRANCPYDSAWIGGFYDGATKITLNSFCPPDSAWIGGFYDGATKITLNSFCPPDSAWIGGFYDGSAGGQQLSFCPSEHVYGGGYYDGASAEFLSCSSPLPIQLLKIIAYWEENDGVVQWITATEINNAGFYLQKKSASGDFKDVAFIKGAGNSNEMIKYYWVDYDLKSNIENEFYYKLKQVDFDGKSSFTDIVMLSKNNLQDKDLLFNASLLPNPAKSSNEIKILINSPYNDNIYIDIYDVTGRVLYSVRNLIQQRLVLYHIPELNLSNGVYSVVIRHSLGQTIIPFIITK